MQEFLAATGLVALGLLFLALVISYIYLVITTKETGETVSEVEDRVNELHAVIFDAREAVEEEEKKDDTTT
jgi:uncharacterized protein YoxC